jgi:NADH:ubiquinone oxidoreductase subunit C
MLRSLGLYLLLATASLADDFGQHVEDHKQNFEVVYTLHNCEEWVDTMIRIQIHETITKIASGLDFISRCINMFKPKTCAS